MLNFFNETISGKNGTTKNETKTYSFTHARSTHHKKYILTTYLTGGSLPSPMGGLRVRAFSSYSHTSCPYGRVGEGDSEGNYATSDEALDVLASQKTVTSDSTSASASTSTSVSHVSYVTPVTPVTSVTPVTLDENVATATTKKVIKSIKTITHHDLSFIFNKVNLEITHPTEFSTVDVINSIRGLLNEMNTISQKGYVNVSDLRVLPIFSDFIDLFTCDEKYIVGEKIIESLKWINSLIQTSLYIKLLEQSEDPTGVKKEDYSTSDEQADLLVLLKNVYKLIDPSVRRFIQKRGITVIKNVYSGFDTEYKKKDEKLNELISVQIATSTKIIIKLPLSSEYKLSTIDAVTNKSYIKKYTEMEDEDEDEEKLKDSKNKKSEVKKGFDFGKIELILNNLAWRIRKIKYPGYDNSISNLILGLNELGVESMSTDD